MNIEIKVIIDASARRVWEVFTDETLLSQWLHRFKSIKTISGEALKKGSKHQMTFIERNKEIIFIETVTKVVPGIEYSFNLSHEDLVCHNSVFLTAYDGKTKLIQKIQMKPHKFMMKLMMPFMKGILQKRYQNDLKKLKILIERQPE